MIVKQEVWETIPLLHVYDETMNEQTPVVIFLHGFMSAKEHNLHYAYQLVQKGVRVILPDALLHGERSTNLTEIQMNANFWKIVLNSVKEVHTLYEQLKQKQLICDNKIGVAGTSMGAIVTSGSLAVYPWIQTAGICMGTTSFTKLATHQADELINKGMVLPITPQQQQGLMDMLSHYNLEDREDMWKNRAIVFWHGERDSVVPYEMSNDFYEQLLQNKVETQIHYISERKAGHAVSRNGMLEVTSYLAQHLA